MSVTGCYYDTEHKPHPVKIDIQSMDELVPVGNGTFLLVLEDKTVVITGRVPFYGYAVNQI